MKKNKINAIWIALILICLSAFNQRANAECPSIGFNSGSIDYDHTSITLTRGEGVACCLHHLKVLCVYENLEPGDEFYVHGIWVSNDSDNTISGHTIIDVYATGNEQILAFFNFVSPDAMVFLAPWEESSEAGGSCPNIAYNYSAHGCNVSTSFSLTNGSVELKLGFGVESALDKGDPKRGLLWMYQEKPSPQLTSPSLLNYSKALDTAIDVVRDEDRTIRQIRGEDGLLNIVPIDAFGYEIQLYAALAVTGWNGEQYETSAPPHYTWKVFNPDRNPENKRLRIEEHTQGFGEDNPPVVHEYLWNETDEAWSLTLGNGLSQDRKQITWNNDRTQRTELEEILDPETGEVARRVERIYGKIHPDDPRMLLLSETLDPGPTAERTEYTYNDKHGTPNFGLKTSVRYHDGNWKNYAYDNQGRVLREHSPWLNSPPSTDVQQNRVLHYDYDAPKNTIDTGHEPWRPRVVIETIQGKEITRTYHLISEDQQWTIHCSQPGAKWNDPDNLVTKTTYLTEGTFAEQPSRIEHPDGTVTTYDYQIQDDRRIETVSRGISTDKKSSEPTEGTRTITITGSAGQVYETHTQDIETGWTLDRTLYSEHDAFHRPERIDYHDGTHERILHDCCGPSQKRDREGRWTNLVFDSLKRPVYEITDTETKIIQYNAAGDVTKIERLNTQKQNLETVETREYDLKGNQILNNKKGRQQRALVTANPLVTITENPDGNNHIETRALDGQLLTLTGTAVHGMRYAHAIEKDGRYHVRTETVFHLDNFGNDTHEWTKTYLDALGRPYKTERADGAETLTTYNQRGQIASQTDPDGITTLYWQDTLGKRTETAIDMNHNGKIDYKGSDRITRTERSTVEIEGVIYTQTRTFQWHTEKDKEPTLASETLQSTDGLISQQTLFPSETKWLSTTTWTEDDPVNPVHFADPAPAVTVKKQTTHHPDGTQTIQTYELTKLISEQRLGSDGAQITRVDYTYDDQNRLIAHTDAYSGTTEYQYDDQGRRTVIIQPAPEEGTERPITRTTYDEMDRVIAIQHPDGTTTHSTYWPTGELKRTWGSRQYPVEYTYDYAGRKSTMTTWQDFVNDTGKAVTQWIYDERNGQLISKRYHDGKGPDYTYTPAGRLKQRVWARGEKTDYKYNSAGDLEKIDYKDKETPDVAYQYDRLGRRIETTQGKDYVQQMTYDALGRVLTETIHQPGVKEHELTRLYNDVGKSSGFEWRKGEDDIQVAYDYDASGRMSSVTDGELEVSYEYLANTGLIEHIGYLEQGQETMRTTKIYDRLKRLLDTATMRNRDGAILSSHAYQYNPANQRINTTDETGSSWNYRYDSLGQVTSGEQIQSDGETTRNYSYDYDWIGNRKRVLTQSHKDTKKNGREDYQTNLLNQYEAINSTDGENAIKTVYQHDEDGNLIRDDKWNYEWNAENRLIAMESLGDNTTQRLEFRYDPQGRRIRKEVFKSEIEDENAKKNPKWKLTKQHHYIYDGWNLIVELDKNENLLRSHLWGLDLSGSLQGTGGVGGLLKTTNHLEKSNTISLLDGNGNIVTYLNTQNDNEPTRLAYDPFGNPLTNNAPIKDELPFQFSTNFRDTETGLLYYGFRYYNAETGRWLNRDPINEKGGVNIYQVCQNNVVNYVDLNGCFFNILGGVSSVLMGGVQAYLQDEPYGPGQIALDFIIGGIPVPGLGAAVARAFKKCKSVRLQAWYTRKMVDSAKNSKDPVTGDLVGSYVTSSIRKEWGFRVEADGAVYQLAWVVTWQGVKWTSNKIINGEVSNVEEFHVSIDSEIKHDGKENTTINSGSSSNINPIIFIE